MQFEMQKHTGWIQKIGSILKSYPRSLWIVLGMSFLLNLDAIWWGIPSRKGWSPDEVLPYHVWEGMLKGFSGGWSHYLYPPLHFYILSIVYLPIYILEKIVPVIDFYDIRVYSAAFLLSRFISVLMGTASVYLVYLCGQELISKRGAVFAALTTALSCTMVYYAKFVNVDIPYLFWFAIALWCYIKLLKTHRFRYYLGYAVAAISSVCTKDQAYGLYVLTTLFIVAELYWYKRTKKRDSSIFSLITDRRIYMPIVTGIALFVIYQNLLFNWAGFIKRIELMTGLASYNTPEYQSYFANTFGNHWELFVRTIADFIFSLGVPLSIVCLLGLLQAFRNLRHHKILLFLLVPILSYYITFISIILYSRDRFLLPVVLILSIFAGNLLDKILSSFHRRTAAWRFSQVAIAGIFTYTLIYSFSVNLMMHQDSRYDAEAWMRQNIPQNSSVVMQGWQHFLPRKEVLNIKSVKYRDLPDLELLQEESPDFIVQTSLFNSETFPESTPEHEAFQKFKNSNLGYEVVSEHYHPPLWNLLPIKPFYLYENPRKRSGNFDKINPKITIFQKTDSVSSVTALPSDC